MRHVKQPLYVVLALIFLAEAWLWDHLEPVVARVVALIPLRAFKAWLARRVERLSPYPTLLVFLAPLVILLVPLKFAEVWLLASHHWIGAIVLIIVSKFVGVGVLAFTFDVTRPKLMQMAWFRRVYDWMLAARQWAHEITAPTVARLRRIISAFRKRSSPRALRVMWRIRRRMQSVR